MVKHCILFLLDRCVLHDFGSCAAVIFVLLSFAFNRHPHLPRRGLAICCFSYSPQIQLQKAKLTMFIRSLNTSGSPDPACGTGPFLPS